MRVVYVLSVRLIMVRQHCTHSFFRHSAIIQTTQPGEQPEEGVRRSSPSSPTSSSTTPPPRPHHKCCRPPRPPLPPGWTRAASSAGRWTPMLVRRLGRRERRGGPARRDRFSSQHSLIAFSIPHLHAGKCVESMAQLIKTAKVGGGIGVGLPG